MYKLYIILKSYFSEIEWHIAYLREISIGNIREVIIKDNNGIIFIYKKLLSKTLQYTTRLYLSSLLI